MISDAFGPVEIDVPRDRHGSFTPVIVKKRQRRLGDVDKIVLSLYGKKMTTGEISAHFAEIYGVSVSKEVISNITDKVIEEQQAWSSRPLASHYVAVFVDAIHVKVRDGAAANRPFYAAIGVDPRGHRDVIGVWAGTPGAGESSTYRISILTELKNRGVQDIFYLVCDGLKGMPDSVNTSVRGALRRITPCIGGSALFVGPHAACRSRPPARSRSATHSQQPLRRMGY